MNGSSFRRAAGAWLIAALLETAGCGRPRADILKPGDLMFAVDPDHLREVEYKSERQRVVAHRWTPSDPFVVTREAADGRTFERCVASGGMRAALARFTSIRVKQSLSETDAEKAQKPPNEWGRLTIWNDTNAEPAAFLVRPSIQGSPPLARPFGSSTTVELEDGLLALLGEHCPSPSAR